jgi:hypothetical protein
LIDVLRRLGENQREFTATGTADGIYTPVDDWRSASSIG